MELKLRHTALDEMAKIGKFDNIEIIVYGNEGPNPHFHFKDIASKHYREGCVRIDIAEYFDHGKYKARFTKDEKEELVRFLNSTTTKRSRFWNPSATNYDVIIALWNMSNELYEIDEDIEMPNYEELSTKG